MSQYDKLQAVLAIFQPLQPLLHCMIQNCPTVYPAFFLPPKPEISRARKLHLFISKLSFIGSFVTRCFAHLGTKYLKARLQYAIYIKQEI